MSAPLAGLDGIAVQRFACIDSTNAEALRQAPALPDRALLLADAQTAGRGRRGRHWQSRPGNVCLSTFARTPRPPVAPGGLAIAVGLAIAERLHEAGLAALRLKWPNDLQVDGRKLGGILVETARLDAGTVEWVVGVGLNVALPDDCDPGQPWTDLRRCGLDLERAQAEVLVATAVFAAIDDFVAAGLAHCLPRWAAFDALHDRDVRVEGGARAGGRVLGLAADGALRRPCAARRPPHGRP